MDLLRALWNTGLSDISALREIARIQGPVSPVGEANKKILSPGTYRKVGSTCPQDCEFLVSGCYAKVGRVAIQQSHDTTLREAAYRSFLVAAVSALRQGKIARIHVSGDFGDASGHVDHEYVHMIADASERLRNLSRKEWVSWGYTHFKSGPWVELLRNAGVAVRLSGETGPWGAVVRSHRKLRRKNEFICPAQLANHMNCSVCRLCWERPDLTVVFLPEGTPSTKVSLRRRLEKEGR